MEIKAFSYMVIIQVETNVYELKENTGKQMTELCEFPSNIRVMSRFPHKAWAASSSIHEFHACRPISRRNMLDILKIQRLKNTM